MAVQKNSRHFQLRRAAERNVAKFLVPTHAIADADASFRVVYAFMQGADWERRRWKSLALFVETPEQTLRSIRRGPPRMKYGAFYDGKVTQ